MRVEAICFDFGGTLDGPADHWLPRFARLYAAVGLAVPAEELRAAFGHATRAGYADAAVARMDLRGLTSFHIARQHEHLGVDEPERATTMIELFVRDAQAALGQSREVLERLHYRYSLGVISNFYGNVDRILDDAGIAPLLTTMVDSNRVGVSKPDPQIFRLALDDLGCAPAAALYVGDSFEKDVVGARGAGLRAAWLVGDADPVCQAPDLVDLRLRRLNDLEAVLA